MIKAKSSLLKLSGTVLALYGLAGCGTTPGAMTPAPGVDPGPLSGAAAPAASTEAPTAPETPAKAVTRAPQGISAKAVPGEIVVKLKKAMGIKSVPNMMHMEAIEDLGNTSVYKVPAGETVEEALAKLRKDPNVVYAEPNYIYRAFGASAKRTVNDPKFGDLWGMTKIQAPQAWDTTTGKSEVLVAVIDTGVDYNHPDLQGQVVKGPDFGNNDADPMDDQGHGTHVAGTIAALGDNGKGVVGVAYNTKILAIKVLGSDGSGDMAAIAKGVLKAHEMGAKVINMSLGGEQDAQTIRDAIDQVTAKGSLVVVAAGNENTTRNTYPAAYASVLSVGATDTSDRRASFSNYGTYVDIAAPGTGILSSTEKDYKKHDGTSMASPHAAGVAALLLAQKGDLTPQQMKSVLESAGDPTTGFKNGIKRLNALKALDMVKSGELPAPKPSEPEQPSQPEQPSRPEQPNRPGQPYPGRPGQPMPYPGQPMPGQPMPGRPMPGQPMPGQPYPGRPVIQPGQPYPGPGGRPIFEPGRPMPGQPMPGRPMPGRQPMPYPGHGGMPFNQG